MEVVGQVAVATVESRTTSLGLLAVADRQGGEVQSGGPAFALFDQVGSLGVAQRYPRRLQQQSRLSLAESQFLDPKLEQTTARTERRQRQGGGDARRGDEHRALSFVADQCVDDLEGRARAQKVEIVED